MGNCWASSSRPSIIVEQLGFDVEPTNKSKYKSEVKEISSKSKVSSRKCSKHKNPSSRYSQKRNILNIDKKTESEFSRERHGALK